MSETYLDAAIIQEWLNLLIKYFNRLALSALRIEDNEHWLAHRVTFGREKESC